MLPICVPTNIDVPNTLRVPCHAPLALQIEHHAQWHSAVHWAIAQRRALLCVGEGSNFVFTQAPEALVLIIRTRGIELVHEDQGSFHVRVAAGENWHDFVQYCLHQGWHGLENLALIPGTVGAAPVQNIGAYGVEASQHLLGVETIDARDASDRYFTTQQCQFRYRHSYFKAHPHFLITHVHLRLHKHSELNTGYASLAQYLREHDCHHPTPTDVFEAVVAVRSARLPDPTRLPNVGSFFHNPIIGLPQAEALLKRYPQIPHYPAEAGHTKLAAGWLIEQCGWKGYRSGDAGVYAQQALVLVNHGQATGQDIMQLAAQIQHSVQQRFDIALQVEPRQIP